MVIPRPTPRPNDLSLPLGTDNQSLSGLSVPLSPRCAGLPLVLLSCTPRRPLDSTLFAFCLRLTRRHASAARLHRQGTSAGPLYRGLAYLHKYRQISEASYFCYRNRFCLDTLSIYDATQNGGRPFLVLESAGSVVLFCTSISPELSSRGPVHSRKLDGKAGFIDSFSAQRLASYTPNTHPLADWKFALNTNTSTWTRRPAFVASWAIRVEPLVGTERVVGQLSSTIRHASDTTPLSRPGSRPSRPSQSIWLVRRPWPLPRSLRRP